LRIASSVRVGRDLIRLHVTSIWPCRDWTSSPAMSQYFITALFDSSIKYVVVNKVSFTVST